MSEPFFTIGHSTRTIEAFVALLQGSGVTLVVDVRTVPRSRANPQFNADALPASLAARHRLRPSRRARRPARQAQGWCFAERLLGE